MIKKRSTLFFSYIFGHQKLWIWIQIHLKCWIRFRTQMNLDPHNTACFTTFLTCSRRRKAGSALCRCSGNSTSSTKAESVCYAGVHPPASGLELKLPGGVVEVYDNPNYSHILIGGQPFFILPSGELSGHVPVPSQGERLSPLHHHGQQQLQQKQQHNIYAGQGSSTYRSGDNPRFLLYRYPGTDTTSSAMQPSSRP